MNNKLWAWLGEWTLFEKTWIAVFTLINIGLFLVWQDTALSLISSLAGMLCVVLVAKGKIANFYFGIIQTATYAYISYGYGLYGETMLNALFYLPTQFVGLYMWQQHKARQQVADEDIEVKRLSRKGWLYLLVAVAVVSAVYAEILIALKAQQVRIDSLAVVLSIVAQILMTLRYAEQWVLWILVNILSIVLWVVTLMQSGGNDYAMLVMWSAFLVNSIYGWYNWLKFARTQAAVASGVA